MSWLLPLALALLLVPAGAAARRLLGSRERDLPLDLATALVALHLLLLATALVPVGWHRLGPLVVLGLLALAWPRRPGPGRGIEPDGRPGFDPGAGDLVAAAVVALFACLTAGRWVTTSDFVYHWGTKGWRFAFADGIDWAWLADPGNWRLHPDYPTLWPELLAVTGRLAGSHDESVLLLWSPLLLAALLLAARSALAGVARGVAQPALAALALLLGTFAIGYETAGAADWFLALAGVLAVPALVTPRTPQADARLAVAAALAASAKIEGVPFAAFLIAAHLLGRGEGPLRLPSWRSAWRVSLPCAAAIVPWLVQARRLHLFLPTNTGGLDLARGAAIWPATLEVATIPAWSAAPFALLLLPLGLASPRHRRLAAALLAQLTFYFWVYYTGPVDTRFYVLASLPRLLLHLIPAAALGLALALPAGHTEREPGERP